MTGAFVLGVVIFAIGVAVWMAREAQYEKDELRRAEEEAEAAIRVARAEANAPCTPDDLVDRLRDPKRGL